MQGSSRMGNSMATQAGKGKHWQASPAGLPDLQALLINGANLGSPCRGEILDPLQAVSCICLWILHEQLLLSLQA